MPNRQPLIQINCYINLLNQLTNSTIIIFSEYLIFSIIILRKKEKNIKKYENV